MDMCCLGLVAGENINWLGDWKLLLTPLSSVLLCESLDVRPMRIFQFCFSSLATCRDTSARFLSNPSPLQGLVMLAAGCANPGKPGRKKTNIILRSRLWFLLRSLLWTRAWTPWRRWSSGTASPTSFKAAGDSLKTPGRGFADEFFSCTKKKQPTVFEGLIPIPFVSTIVLSKNRPFSLGFRRFSRKKDPWKEWGSYS